MANDMTNKTAPDSGAATNQEQLKGNIEGESGTPIGAIQELRRLQDEINAVEGGTAHLTLPAINITVDAEADARAALERQIILYPDSFAGREFTDAEKNLLKGSRSVILVNNDASNENVDQRKHQLSLTTDAGGVQRVLVTAPTGNSYYANDNTGLGAITGEQNITNDAIADSEKFQEEARTRLAKEAAGSETQAVTAGVQPTVPTQPTQQVGQAQVVAPVDAASRNRTVPVTAPVKNTASEPVVNNTGTDTGTK